MSLLDSPVLIEIKLYYKYVKVGNGRKIIILDDKKAEEMLKDAEKSKEVEVLETQWSMLTWKEQNEVIDISSSKIADPMTGEKQFNFLAYRDAIIKRCLRSWNLTMDGKEVPVSAEAIDMLPGPVVIDIYQKFDVLIEFSEEELGN